MKKYLLGFIALLMAVSFSAFTSNTAKKTSSKFEESLYWYPVKANSTEIDHNALINPSTQYTKTEMDGLDLIPCPIVAGTDCIRGFETVQTSDHDTPGIDFTQKAN